MKDSLIKSGVLHVVVFILCMVQIPFFWSKKMVIDQVPIIVDLNQVKISEMTNLPPKAKIGKEDKEASKTKRKVEDNFTKEEPKKEEKKPEPKEEKKAKEEPAPVKDDETPKPPKQDFLVAPQPKKPTALVKKTEVKKEEPKPKVEPKKEEKKVEPKKENKAEPKLANPLKSLLASVDELEKDDGKTDTTATLKEGTQVNNMGIDGGVGGSYFSELSISETDAIAGRLRACWNLDPGAMGIKDMIVEIRAFLNQDGSVKEVKVLDTGRYNSDTAYRSVADSARRAVYVCAPYKIFANKYADKYDMWKTMLLRFNPLDGNVK